MAHSSVPEVRITLFSVEYNSSFYFEQQTLAVMTGEWHTKISVMFQLTFFIEHIVACGTANWVVVRTEKPVPQMTTHAPTEVMTLALRIPPFAVVRALVILPFQPV